MGTTRCLRESAVAALLLGASAIAFAAPGASAQTAPPTPPAQDEAAGDEPAPVQDIIVRGIRGSLSRAADAKRNAGQVKDVIDAEDIGKLPDTNVAESLQRITGVQINRDLGEGAEVSVRGFAQNRVEINGQTQLGTGAEGTVAFNTIPSEAFSSLEVVKTPMADDIEGSLGGIVRLNTRKPLDNNGKLILSGSAQGQYAERADKWTPNLSVLASKGWTLGETGEAGILLSYTRNRRKLRQDFFDVRGWEAVNGFGLDLDGDGVRGEPIQRTAAGTIANLQDGAYVPLQTRIRVIEQNRKLDSWTGAIQLKPNDRFEFYVNGTYSRSRFDDAQYQAVAGFNSAVTPDTVNGGSRIGTQYSDNLSSAVISDDQTVLSAFLGSTRNGRPTGVAYNISGSSNPPEQNTYSLQTGIKYTVTDRLKVEGQLAIGSGKQFNRFINTTSGISGTDRPFFFFNFGTGDDIPTLIPLQTAVGGVPVTGNRTDAQYDFTRKSIYTFNNIAVNRDRQSNEETAFRLDFDYETNWGPISSLEFGGRIATTHVERQRIRGRDGPGAADGTLGQTAYTALDTTEPGLITALPFDDVLAGASGTYPRFFFLPDPRYLTTNLDRLVGKYSIPFAVDSTFDFAARRDDQAAYVKANLRFDVARMPVYGNVGVRYIRTDRSVQGPVPGGTMSAPTLTNLSVDFDYSRFLPSLNLIAEPARRFYVRFGAARTIARPEILDLSPGIVIADSFDRARGGNPNLLPQEVNQFDLSFEKYYGKANLISVALFYKDFKQRIEDGVSELCLPTPPSGLEETPGNDGCLVGQDRTRLELPVNVGGAKVKGVEVGIQQAFSFLPSPLDGFGVIGNYTYVDAGGGSVSATGAVLPVQDLSKHSYNVIGYFEKWGFQARAAYNWRSTFYDERSDTNQASFAKPYGQLDASASYDIIPNVTVTFEAQNLLNTPEQRYQEVEERILSYRLNDRRFLFGIRIRN